MSDNRIYQDPRYQRSTTSTISNQSYSGASPGDVGFQIAGNALNLLGKIGLRRFQLNTFEKASGLISYDTSNYKSKDDIDADLQAIESASEDVRSLYALSEDPRAMELVNNLNKKKDILNKLEFDESGNLIDPSTGSKEKAEEELYRAKNSIENMDENLSEWRSTTEDNIEKAVKDIDRYLDEINSSSEEEDKKNIDRLTKEESEKYYSPSLRQQRIYALKNRVSARRALKRNIKFLNEKLDKKNLTEKDRYEIRKKYNEINNIREDYISPNDIIERDKIKAKYKAKIEKNE